MIDLLNTYSLEQVIIFIVLLSLAVKGVISFIDWAKEKIVKEVDKSKTPAKLQTQIDDHQIQLKKINEAINNLTNMVNLLLKSDRDDIKAFITRQHHYFCYQKGWIDDYSLDCIEKRFAHYQEQGGNTFIEGMMEELRKLPKREKEIQGG